MGLITRLGRATARAAKEKVKSVFGDEPDRSEEEADEDAILAAEDARDAAATRPRPRVPAAPPPPPTSPPAGGKRSL